MTRDGGLHDGGPDDRRNGDAIEIWVIDDDPDVAVHLALIVERTGHVGHISTFLDATSARAAAGLPDAHPQLVLVDQVLPDARGTELRRELQERFPQAVIRLVTAAPDEVDDVDRAIGVVSKPPSAAVIGALLDQRGP